MRLIDADELKTAMDECIYSDRDRFSTGYAKSFIDDAPTVDAVPVVRCKDCKYKGWIQEPCHGKSIDYCRQLERPVDKQFFCGLGKRKGEDE